MTNPEEHGGPAVVGALVSDLFFSSRIRGALAALGYGCWVATDVATLVERARAEPPSLVLVDLGIQGVDWAAAVAQLRGAFPNLAIVAFGPHRDLDARQLALTTGCQEVVANSKFVTDLPRIVARWVQQQANETRPPARTVQGDAPRP